MESSQVRRRWSQRLLREDELSSEAQADVCRSPTSGGRTSGWGQKRAKLGRCQQLGMVGFERST